MEISRDNDQKRKESPHMETSRDNDQNHAYISNKMQLENFSLTLINKNNSLFSATSVLPRSPLAYNTTASLNKLTRTNYVDFGNFQDRFRQFSCSKKYSNYLVVKVKVFKKDDNEEF